MNKIYRAITTLLAALALAIHDAITNYGMRSGLILCAKVSGPMFSLDARGKFASALVFSNWKGRPTVRQLVQPSNPMSAAQVTARNIVRVFGAIQRFVNLQAAVTPAEYRDGGSVLDKNQLITAAPAGQAWNGHMVKMGVGAAQVSYDAAVVAWGNVTDKAGWTTAAGLTNPAIPEVAQMAEDNVPAANMAAGEVYFIYIYTLYLLGLSALKDETPPTWA